ncbi:MAG: DNA-formamidopyrimidine glycosylase, partial [Alphaproteobacteria bacterium]|nr:DNA-formamidopyrimidine glycosylase [Alphaproteobacteria bacterium]
MPELPEVETVCRGLEGPLVGQQLTKVTQRRDKLRWPLPDNFAQRLQGRTIQRLYRRAPYILAALGDGWGRVAPPRLSGPGVIPYWLGPPPPPPGPFFLVAGGGPPGGHPPPRPSLP